MKWMNLNTGIARTLQEITDQWQIAVRMLQANTGRMNINLLGSESQLLGD